MAYHKIHEPIASNINCSDCNWRVELSNLILCPFLSESAKVGQRQNKPTTSGLHIVELTIVTLDILAGFVLSFGNWIVKKLNEPRDKARSVRIDQDRNKCNISLDVTHTMIPGTRSCSRSK